MNSTSNKLILNSDYYSANTYTLKEKTKTISIQILFKLIIIFIIFGISIFLYIHYIKNNSSAINLWIADVKQTVLFEYLDTEPRRVMKKQVEHLKKEK